MLGPGDTFQTTSSKAYIDNHLWVVISDPDAHPTDKVLIVNLTSWRKDREQVCLLSPADHPFISRKTCVNYAESRIVDRAKVEKALDSGLLQSHETATKKLLKRIRDGAAVSRRIPLANAEFLRCQGLIE